MGESVKCKTVNERTNVQKDSGNSGKFSEKMRADQPSQTGLSCDDQ